MLSSSTRRVEVSITFKQQHTRVYMWLLYKLDIITVLDAKAIASGNVAHISNFPKSIKVRVRTNYDIS